MEELKDYSGPFVPNLEFESLSKEALVRLLKNYQLIFVGFMGMCNTMHRERMSGKEAYQLDADIYQKFVSKFPLPLVTQAMNIRGNDVVTMLKYFQMAPDGARKGLYEFTYDIKNNNHAILTFTRCPSMFYLERKGTPEDINSLCGPGGVEERAFIEICKYFNPNMKCRALKLPPRKSQNDICCQWEFKVEA
jgi:hypothetical protein